MIFCESCSCTLTGEHNRNGSHTYRHNNNGCTHRFNVKEQIEKVVITDIFYMLGDLPSIEQAANNAIANAEEAEALQLTITQAQKELAKNEQKNNNLLQQVEDGFLAGEEVKQRMAALKDTESCILSQLDIDKAKIQNIPSKKSITRKAQLMFRLTNDILKSKGHLEEMSWDDKHKLLQSVFDGKDKDGRRLGVYMGKNKKW